MAATFTTVLLLSARYSLWTSQNDTRSSTHL